MSVTLKIFKYFKGALPLFLIRILKTVYYRVLFYRVDGYWIATKRDFGFFIPSLDAAGLAKICWFKELYQRYFKVELADVILDVGSCLGSFSVCASYATGNKGLVVSIEPAPENLFYLKKNLSTLKNIVIINKCISNFKGETVLYLSSNLQTYSVINYTSNSLKIPTDTLDNITSELKLDRVDFIKINVEGAELEVLEGANKVLKMTKKVVVEAHHIRDGQPTCWRVKELLKKHGFDVLITPDEMVFATKGGNG